MPNIRWERRGKVRVRRHRSAVYREESWIFFFLFPKHCPVFYFKYYNLTCPQIFPHEPYNLQKVGVYIIIYNNTRMSQGINTTILVLIHDIRTVIIRLGKVPLRIGKIFVYEASPSPPSSLSSYYYKRTGTVHY